LRQIGDISKDERNYLNQVFEKDLEDGITKEEMTNRIKELRVNYEDDLDAREVEQIKEKFLGKFDY